MNIMYTVTLRFTPPTHQLETKLRVSQVLRSLDIPPTRIGDIRTSGILSEVPAADAQDLVHRLNAEGLDIPLGQVPGTSTRWYPGTRVYNDTGDYIIALDTEGKGFSDWRGMSTQGWSTLSDYVHTTPTQGLACTVSGHPRAQYSVEGKIGLAGYSL